VFIIKLLLKETETLTVCGCIVIVLSKF